MPEHISRRIQGMCADTPAAMWGEMCHADTTIDHRHLGGIVAAGCLKPSRFINTHASENTPEALICMVSVLPDVVVTSAGVLSSVHQATTRSGVGVVS